MGLSEITELICDVVQRRSQDDKNFGVVLIPEQLMGSISEMRQLCKEIDQIRQVFPEALEVEVGLQIDFNRMAELLSPSSRTLFNIFPERVRLQLCLFHEADETWASSKRVDLSEVETE